MISTYQRTTNKPSRGKKTDERDMLLPAAICCFAHEIPERNGILTKLIGILKEQSYHAQRTCVVQNDAYCPQCDKELEIYTDGQRTIHKHAQAIHGCVDVFFGAQCRHDYSV
jgi:hypothetical protein